MLRLMRKQTKDGRKRTEGVEATFMAVELLLFFSEQRLDLFLRADVKPVDEPEERHNTDLFRTCVAITLADLV
jgi:hypothetical protein